MTNKAPLPTAERGLLLTLAAVQFTHIMDFMILMPLGPQLMRLFQITPQQFGLLVSAYTFSAGILGFLSAFVIDRFDRRQVLLFLYTGFVLGTLACALAPSYLWLLAARILTGAFGGVLSAVVMAVVGDAIPMARRGRAMGIVTAAFSAASVFGVPLGLYLATRLSWHAPFFFLVLAGVGVWGLILHYVPRLQSHVHQDASQRPGPLQILRNAVAMPAQRLALLLTLLMMLGQFSIIPFISPYMVANVGFSESQLTYIYLLGGGLTLFTGPWIGRLADRYGKTRMLMLFLLVSTLPQLLVTHLPPVPLFVALMVTTSFFVVSGGRIIPAMALITGAVSPQQRGSFMSIQSSVQQVSAGLASFVAGMLIVAQPGPDGSQHLLNYPLIGYLAVITSLLCMVVVWRMQRLDLVSESPASRPATAELTEAPAA